jgi:hypothetical protein
MGFSSCDQLKPGATNELGDDRSGQDRAVSVITMLVSASEWALAIREACDHQSARTKQIADGPQQGCILSYHNVLKHVEGNDQI